nr:YopX family protein [uncultured Anaerocolumna sp.]
MQREIKFRGQRVDTKEWVYGYLVKDSIGTTCIITYFGCSITACSDCGVPAVDYYEVIPETVGQYTGLKDKNGKEIYEGDILWCDLGWKYAVEWDEEEGRFIGYTLENERKIVYVNRDPKSGIIGNLFDNPELLQEVEK